MELDYFTNPTCRTLAELTCSPAASVFTVTALSGKVFFSFLSRTMDMSADSLARAWCAGVLTMLPSYDDHGTSPGGSAIPSRNWTLNRLMSALSMVLMSTVPSATDLGQWIFRAEIVLRT